MIAETCGTKLQRSFCFELECCKIHSALNRAKTFLSGENESLAHNICINLFFEKYFKYVLIAFVRGKSEK